MKILDTELIHNKGRKGLIEPETSGFNRQEGRPSPDNQSDLLSLLQDSTVNGIMMQQVAKLSEGNMLFKGKEPRIKELRKILKEQKERRKRRKTFSNLLVYQNAFWELGYKKKKLENFWVLETREMEIVDNKHGKILGYVQENKLGNVSFAPNQVIHFKTLEITSDNWGYAYNKNLIRIVNAKIWVQNYLHWLVKTNQFRNLFSFTDAGDKVNDFLAYLRTAENNPTKHLVIESENFVNTILRDFRDGGNFIALIAYYNSEIYRILQSPPIVAGTVDNSNRSNSEAQLNSTYFSWMNYLRNEIYMDYFNNDYLPLLGFDDIEASLPPIDGVVNKEEVEVAKQLKELGLNKKGLKLFLQKSGLEFTDGVKLEEPEPVVTGFGGMTPSRKPQDNFKDSKTGKKSSTREEQLHGKSKPIDFNNYPYTMY